MRPFLLAAAVATAGAAGGGQLAGHYVGDTALWAVASAAVGSAVVGRLAARHPALALPAHVVGLLAQLITLQRLVPSPDGLLDALPHAGARLLTSASPVPAQVDTLALPVMATWIAVAVSDALTRGRRPGAAVLPPVVLATAMLVLAGPRRDPGYPLTALLIASLILLLALTRTPPTTHRQARLSRAGTTLLLATALAAAAGLLTPVLLRDATSRPPDLRAVVVPPVRAADQTHPLSLLGRWQAHPEQPLLALDSSRPVTLRWAVLPDFDGTAWQPADSYLAAGGERVRRRPAVAVEPLHARVTVLGLTGGWLPVPDGLDRVSGLPIAVDEKSGGVVVPGGLRAGQSYEVEAAVPAPTPAQLVGARIPVTTDLDAYRELPPGNTGPIFSLALDAAGDGLPFQQATALANWLKQHHRYDPLAPGGSGYPSLVRFLTAAPQLGGGRGTSEQFAAAYAVLARALGIPARVVVGFGPKAAGEASTVATITAADARAWPEVYLEPVGWIPMDVTAPRASDDPGANAAPPPPSTAPSPLPEPAVPELPAQRAQGGGATGAAWRPLATLPVLAAGIPALILALRVRRSLRRRAGPDDLSRLRGAWAELLDAARLAGIRVEPHWTVGATVAAVSVAVPAATATHLVTAVNRTRYAARPDAEGARLAVTEARDLAYGVRRSTGRLRRLLWWLDPRPLWW